MFLPVLGNALASQAAVVIGARTANLLHYRSHTVVMHRRRMFAIYSAANVDFANRHKLSRPKDTWLTDPRIRTEFQVDASYYEGNEFDRGHLTRYEDMEYGNSKADARARAADTNHWTNCTPQHSKFNRGRELWQGIERHILERAIKPDGFRAQVVTGPLFSASDPVLPGFPLAPYPLRYWKVASAINASGRLFSTAFILDQTETIAQFGVRTRAAPEVPFKPYKTFQVTIAQVERLTGLSFTGSKGVKKVPLSTFDPLAQSPRVRGARAVQPVIELDSLDAIHTA